jgi:hypothetical protein
MKLISPIVAFSSIHPSTFQAVTRFGRILIMEDEGDDPIIIQSKFNEIFNCCVIYGIIPFKLVDAQPYHTGRVWECSMDYFVEIDPIYATNVYSIIKTLDSHGYDSSFLLT